MLTKYTTDIGWLPIACQYSDMQLNEFPKQYVIWKRESLVFEEKDLEKEGLLVLAQLIGDDELIGNPRHDRRQVVRIQV